MAAHSFVEETELAAPLEGIHEGSGARFQEGAEELRLVRHYGDPASEYDSAVRSCAMIDRSHRSRWRVEGRDPARMLNGIVTNTIPEPARRVEGRVAGHVVGAEGSKPRRAGDAAGAGNTGDSEGGTSDGREPGWTLSRGRAPYGLTLTPKGRVVSDHRLLRLGDGDDEAFLLDVPAAGARGLRSHFERFLPPRFATVVDVSRTTGMLSVVGPEAPRVLGASLHRLAEEAGGPAAPGDPDGLEPGELEHELARMEEGELLLLTSPPPDRGEGDRDDPGSPLSGAVLVLRSGELGPAGGVPGDGSPDDPGHPVSAPPPVVFDVVAARDVLRALWASMRESGCAPMGWAAWETLRVEGGRPAFGVDMDDDTIPVEAGVHERAIDYEKGCYTGQEVIVRIRDRGRVNRHLRRFLLGDRPTPGPGTELYLPEAGRPVGWITSAVESPRFGQVVALGYARREVEPPARVRLGSPEGPWIEARSLETEGSQASVSTGRR